MKILQINAVYKVGSTGKIVYDLHKSLLDKGYDSIVCYGRGKLIHDKYVFKFCKELEAKIHRLCNFFLGILPLSGSYFPTRRLIKVIESECPDIVHIHCINGNCLNYYKLLKYLGKSNIKTVITHHAEFLYTGGCSHAYDCEKWSSVSGCKNCEIGREVSDTLFFNRAYQAWIHLQTAYSFHASDNLVNVGVSPWLKNRIQQSPLLNRFRSLVVGNGIDTNVFHYRKVEYDRFSDFRNKPIVFHASASFSDKVDDPKGGAFIINLAKSMPQYNFVVAALDVQVENTDLPSNLFLLGKIKNQIMLAELYSMANVTLIVSKRETFSMVTVESLCCGTPVVGFKAGGPESIALPLYSNFVEYGDIQGLIGAIETMVQTSLSKLKVSEIAKAQYSKLEMCENYIKVYKQLLKTTK